MNVFSIINRLSLENSAKYILPTIVIGLLCFKFSSATSEVLSSVEYGEEADSTVEGISYCDEHLISGKQSSKR